MVWFEYFYVKRNYRKKKLFFSPYDISLELDILCPESDSRKLVLGSLVKKIFETEYIP